MVLQFQSKICLKESYRAFERQATRGNSYLKILFKPLIGRFHLPNGWWYQLGARCSRLCWAIYTTKKWGISVSWIILAMSRKDRSPQRPWAKSQGPTCSVKKDSLLRFAVTRSTIFFRDTSVSGHNPRAMTCVESVRHNLRVANTETRRNRWPRGWIH